MPNIETTQIHSNLREDLEAVSFSRIGALGSCPSKHYLRYRMGEKSAYTAVPLWVGTHFHRACELYYKYEAESVIDGAMTALTETWAKNNLSMDLLDAAIELAGIEATIMDKFRSGEILNDKGELYSSPKMTKKYKELAAKMGLYKRLDAVKDLRVGDLDPNESAASAVSRVLMLAERYNDTILIPREFFKTLRVEEGFDFSIDLPNGKPFRFRGFMDLVGEGEDGNVYLIDYKSGAAKSPEDHLASAHSTLQLTLYHFVMTHIMGYDPAKVKVALHYPDAAFVAETYRVDEDWQTVLNLAMTYLDVKDSAGIPGRLFYDSPACKGCELRGACERTFGFGSCAAREFASARS